MMKCLDCGNTTKFVTTYLDYIMKEYDDNGEEKDTYSVGYELVSSTICGMYPCESTNISQEEN